MFIFSAKFILIGKNLSHLYPHNLIDDTPYSKQSSLSIKTYEKFMVAIKVYRNNRSSALTSLARCKNQNINHLDIRGDTTITTQYTRLLKEVASIAQLTVWSPMTRTALHDCFSIKGLEMLSLFELVSLGKVIDTSKASNLRVVNIMSPSKIDRRIFARLPNLTEVITHDAEWSIESLTRLIDKPLIRLELEGSRLGNDKVDIISSSNTITCLSMASTGLTGKRLAKIVQMSQLEWLDIWNTKIRADDLASLVKLQNLNYLSIGGYCGQRYLNMEKAIPQLLKIPNLTTLWVDNILLTDEQLSRLKKNIEHVLYNYEDAYDE